MGSAHRFDLRRHESANSCTLPAGFANLRSCANSVVSGKVSTAEMLFLRAPQILPRPSLPVLNFHPVTDGGYEFAAARS